MRILAVLAVLLLATLAGCTQSNAPATTTMAKPDPAAFAVPAKPKVDAALTLSDLKAFAGAYPIRKGANPLHEGARQWLLKQFQEDGYTVWRQNFTNGIDQANIVGIHWGQVRDEWVVVGGHYDTTTNAGEDQSAGTYDDGSGTMHTVELAKAWKNIPSYYTIAFVAYDGEERGIQGAKAFITELDTGNTTFGSVTFHAALDIDMFGITWPGTNAPTQILDNSNALHKVFDDERKSLNMPDNMVYCEDMATLGSSDFQAYFSHKPDPVPTAFFSSDFGKVAPPGSPVPMPMFAYPFWHQVDTYDTMQAMAGGATQLQQGFQTASDIVAAELHAMADTPTLALDVHAPPKAGGPGPLDTASCA